MTTTILGVWLLLGAIQAAAQAPPVTVVVAQVEQRQMAPMMWVPGTVVSRNDAWISAEVSGRLTNVAEVGDTIANEGVLAQLDQRALQLRLEDNEANIKRLQASLAFNAKQLDRLQQLRKSDSASKTQYDQATTQREMVAQELIQAKTASARTQYDLDRTTVRAPFNGRVAERALQAGEFASVGARLLRLVDVQQLEIRANAPIAVARHLRQGSQVAVRASGHEVTGLLRAVVPVGDAISRSIEVRVSVTSHFALVGSAVRVALPTESLQTVNAVPRDAIHLRSHSQHVIVVENNKATVVPVTPGVVSGNWIAVDQVERGQRVVLRGGERLRNGQTISILEPGQN